MKIEVYSQHRPSAHHHQAADVAIDLDDALRVIDIGIVERDPRESGRPGPRGDQHDAGIQHALATGIVGHAHGPVGLKPRASANDLDAVTLEVPADRIGHRLDDLGRPGPELRDGRVWIEHEPQPVDLPPTEAGDV